MPKRRNTTVTDSLFDANTAHTVDLLRYNESERRVVEKHLNRLERDLLALVARLDPTEGSKSTRRSHVNRILTAADSIISDRYRQLRDEITSDLGELRIIEGDRALRDMERILKVEALPEATRRRTASRVEGKTVPQWISRLATRTRHKLSSALQKSLSRDLTLTELNREIRGRTIRGSGTVGGLIRAGKQEAEALLRTSILDVANDTTLRSAQAMPELIKGVQANAVLDHRTSLLCISRDGGAWDLKTGKPIDGSPVDYRFPGPPPWHFNCRTSLVPILKSWDELTAAQKKLYSDIPEGVRSRMTGRPARRMQYEEWLSEQSEDTQRRVLGPNRLEMWKSGKIGSLQELVDQAGRAYTLDQLRRST
jgi:hypothetical protein